MIKDDNFLKSKADFCLSRSKQYGATDTSVVVKNSVSENINIRNNKLDGSERSDDINVALTTYIGKKKASITSTNLEEKKLDELIKKCLEATKITPEDDLNSLPDKNLYFKGAKNLDLFDETHLSNKTKIEFIKEAETEAFKDSRIINTNGSGFSENKSNFVLANSNGFMDGYKTSQFTAYCEAVSKKDGSMERDYEFTSKRFFDQLLSPKEIGRNAAKRSIDKLNPKKIASDKLSIIFDKRISKNFLSTFASSISSSSIAKGTSFLKGKLNEQIFKKEINIIDKANIKKANGSKYFDSEGIYIKQLNLVNNGILNDYLTDTYSGKKINRKSNGRSSGTTNLYFENGSKSFSDLKNCSKKILYINETIGRGANTTTGDYSVGASGIMIENGEFTYPVSEITIAGNFLEIFKNMTLADDLEFNYATNSPTMLVEGMTVGGV